LALPYWLGSVEAEEGVHSVVITLSYMPVESAVGRHVWPVGNG